MTYEICGTISLKYKGTIITVHLVPAAGYISPDKKKAVCYPANGEGTTAVLIRLQEVDGVKNIVCAFKVFKPVPTLISLLTEAAASSKKIRLLLDDTRHVTGCQFPAP